MIHNILIFSHAIHGSFIRQQQINWYCIVPLDMVSMPLFHGELFSARSEDTGALVGM